MIPFRATSLPPVSDEEMKILYEKIKTPKKHGAVIKWENDFVDCPTVFQKDGTFYMYFISISKDYQTSGYETHLAKSNDLLHWDYVGPIFQREEGNRWDSRQIAGYGAFIDNAFDGSYEPHPVNGSYYISYIGANNDGYEPDPLYMGLAKSADPIDRHGFVRMPEPILRPEDPDVRYYESCTLYKSHLFEDVLGVTGYPYVNAYNGKAPEGKERIFLAVSNDGEHWERYGDKAIIDMVSNDPKGNITGDPQIVVIDDIYVMFFFRFVAGKPAFDTFACSRDLEHWNIWTGKPLIESEYEWENVHAHKPWFLRHKGINYHFYCAVNDKNERYIAVATSEP